MKRRIAIGAAIYWGGILVGLDWHTNGWRTALGLLLAMGAGLYFGVVKEL